MVRAVEQAVVGRLWQQSTPRCHRAAAVTAGGWTETLPLGGTLLSGGQRKGHHIPPTLTLAGKKGRLGATRDETDGRL